MALSPPPDPESGDDILPWARSLTRLLRQIVPKPSKDIFPRIGNTGTTYELRRQPRGEEPRARRRHPFELLNASDGDGPKLKVHLDSWLMNSRDADDRIAITGLDAAFEIAVGDFIWIEAPVTDEEVSGTASIEHGAAWASYPSPNAGVGAAQTAIYRLIGYAQAFPGEGGEIAGNPADFPSRLVIPFTGEDDEPAAMQIVQTLSTNLIVSAECSDTDNVLGFADWCSVPAPS